MKLRNFGLFTLFLYMTLLSVHSLEAKDLPDTVYLHDGWTFGPPAKPARFPATVPVWCSRISSVWAFYPIRGGEPMRIPYSGQASMTGLTGWYSNSRMNN